MAISFFNNKHNTIDKSNNVLLDTLSEGLMDLVDNDDNILCLEQLFVEHGMIRLKQWNKLRRNYKIAQEAHDYILNRLFKRLAKMFIDGTGSKKYIKDLLPRYSPELLQKMEDNAGDVMVSVYRKDDGDVGVCID